MPRTRYYQSDLKYLGHFVPISVNPSWVETPAPAEAVDMWATTDYGKITDEGRRSYEVVRRVPKARDALFKDVYHERWSIHGFDHTPRLVYFGYPQGTKWTCPAVYSRIAYVYTGHYPDLGFGMLGDVPLVIANFDELSGHYNRWNRVKPSMATRANLFQFLVELKDFKRMFDLIPKKHTGFNTWKQLRGTVGYGNDVHLNYNFGWKPFVRDIMSVYDGIGKFNKKLDRLLDNADKDLRRRVRDEVATELSYTRNLQTVGSSGWQMKTTVQASGYYGSAFNYRYVLPEYGRDELFARAWADMLGLNITPANVWRVLPSSFIVDWFFNVGGILDQYSSNWIEPAVTMTDAAASRKLNCHVSIALRTPTVDYGGRWYPALTANWACYRRRVALPKFQAAFQDLDADKIRLGASLIASWSRIFR